MGGFHIALNYLAVIGKKFEDSRLEDLLVESGTFGSNTTSVLLKGKSYNRGVRVHKMAAEAMQRLQWQGFSTWLTEKYLVTPEEEEKTLQLIQKCRASLARKEEDVQHNFEVLSCEMDCLCELLNNYQEEGRATSHLFHFWGSYIQMVQLLLRYIRAEREGSWSLHLSVTAQMAPHFFAMDRTNYSRWLPVYLGDMHQLSVTEPEIHQEFMDGGHPISRSTQPFSQVWTDMALEQSVNLDSKSNGGIVGISLNPGALERWFLTVHEGAAITTRIKSMYSMGECEKVSGHKETGSSPFQVVGMDFAGPIAYKISKKKEGKA